MNAADLIRRLHQHRAWVNGKLLAAVAGLSEESLRASFAIGQGSIWQSLTHMYAAEYVWLETLLGNEQAIAPGDAPGLLPGNQDGEGACRSLGELRDRWWVLQERWERYLAGMGEQELSDLVYRISTSSRGGRRFGTRRSDVLLHVCTHAQYTTAQVINMLRQAGVKDVPDAMLITLARVEAAVLG